MTEEYVIPDEILVVPTPVETTYDEGYDNLRDENVGRGTWNVKAVNVSLSTLSTGLKEFLSQVDVLLKDIPKLSGNLSLSEVEVSAGVTASGKFTLFGTGVEGGAEGGIKFVFTKTPHEANVLSATKE